MYFQGEAQHHCYDYIFPEVAVPQAWFSYRNLGSYIKMELPPNLHNNLTWIGLTIFTFYTVDKQRVGSSYKPDSTIFLHFSGLSASDEVLLAPYGAFPCSRDVFVESSQRLLVFYIPRKQFQLNHCSHICAQFQSDVQVVKFKMCGISLVYEQNVEEFLQTLVQCFLGTPDNYHPSLYQNILVQLEQLQDRYNERGFCSSLSPERSKLTGKILL